MDQLHYQSKSQMKRVEKQLEADAFIKEKKIKEIEKRWEDSQIKAATMQSVLDYVVEQYESHKSELSEDVVTKTEEQIQLRVSEIKEFLMSEKEVFRTAIEEYNGTVTTVNYNAEEKNG